MARVPFRYGFTVSDQTFIDREQELARLKSNLLGGINTILLAPRRWGKSSLVEKTLEQIKQEEAAVKIVHIDLFAAANETEFLQLFARELIKASSNRWEEWMEAGKKFFKRLVPKLSVGNEPFHDFHIGFEWSDLEQHTDELLNLPELIAEDKNCRFIICIDEFQNLATFSSFASLEKKMRACWQRQKRVSYCLYGSKRQLMAELFNHPSRPFYRFGDLMTLPKIAEHHWVNYIVSGFEHTHKRISSDLALTLTRLMQNHAWYVQQLAHYLWSRTQAEADVELFNAALDELIQANSPLYQREIEVMSTTQLNLLRAIAKGESQLSSVEVMRHYALGTPNNVTKNKRHFITNDFIEESELKTGTRSTRYDFVDPAFALWFKKRFFGKEYRLRIANR